LLAQLSQALPEREPSARGIVAQLDGILISANRMRSMQRHRPRYVPLVGLFMVAGFVFIIATFFCAAIAHSAA
jgi:hypothetical protein